MNRSHLFRLGCALGFAGTLLGGCSPGSDGSIKTFGLFDRNTNDSIATARSKRSSGGVRIVDLVFEVRRAEIVRGDLQHSRKIWNHVDELRLGVDRVAGLARNGFRIGAASPGTWPAITAVLTSAGARMETQQLVTQRGMPLAIGMGAVEDGSSIFTYDRSNRLSGKTYRGGEKLINLEYELHPQLGGSIDIGVRLEIRRDLGVMTWERQGDAIRQVPAYDRQMFEHLDVALALHPGEFLVIGPSAEVDNAYLLGSRYLCRNRNGKRVETILFITPQPYQTIGGEAFPSRVDH